MAESVKSRMEASLVTNQGNVPPTSSAAHAKDAEVLASEFDSLPTDYQNVIRLAQQQHGSRIVPLQERRLCLAHFDRYNLP